MCLQQICHSNATNMSKLLNVYLWGKNTNIHATDEVASITNVAESLSS